MTAFKNNAQQLRFIADRLQAHGFTKYAKDLRAIADDCSTDQAGEEEDAGRPPLQERPQERHGKEGVGGEEEKEMRKIDSGSFTAIIEGDLIQIEPNDAWDGDGLMIPLNLLGEFVGLLSYIEDILGADDDE